MTNTVNHRLAVVIPTKDRPDDLRKLLASLKGQSRRPDQLIVVDGSEPDISHVVAEFRELPVEYVRVFPPSLAKQRNAGMASLASDITLAGYLDDDIVLESDSVEEMMRFWETCGPEYGGLAFNIVNNPSPGGVGLKQLLGIDHRIPGKVLASGFPSTIYGVESDLETDWLYGGATIWRREVISRYPYDEWYVGTGFMEDIDYSYGVRGTYRLGVVAAARLAHYSRPVRLDRQMLLGFWQIANRMYFVRKYRDRGLKPSAAWFSSLSLALLNFGAGVLRRDRAYLHRFAGNIRGMMFEVAGKRVQIGGHLK